MKKTKALVTGARGFIGGWLCERLISEGYDVVALSRTRDNTQHLSDKGMTVLVGDITRPDDLKGICEGIEIVFHLAAKATNAGSKKAFRDSICNGTRYLLDESVGNVSLFVYVSSVCAAGKCGRGKHANGFTEDMIPSRTGSYYDDAKMDAEEIVWQYRREKNLKATIVRPSVVIGPGKSPWTFALLDEMEKGKFPIVGRGRYFAGLIYVENLIDGIMLVAKNEVAEGRIYQFRDDYDVTWKRYLDDIASMANKPVRFVNYPFWLMWTIATLADWTVRPLYIHTEITRHIVGLMGRNNDFDTTRAKEELGWQTRVSYQEAIDAIRECVARERTTGTW